MAASRKVGKRGGDSPGGADTGEVVSAASRIATDLVIRPAEGRALSREQRAFNRLTTRIADLERLISAERSKLELFLGRYHDKVSPLEHALARRQIELARALSAASGRLALRGKHKDAVREMLLDLCSQAFEAQKPDADDEALYDEWADVSYREEVRQDAEDLKWELAEELRSRFGVDVDIPEDSSPETMARFFHELEEKARVAAAAQPPPQSRGSGAKRAGRTARRGRPAATARSLREIYLSLAKVLHPDVAADDEGRLREESMKKAIRAYRESDVTALLELELRWVARAKDGCSALPDDALRRYIPALKEQAARLEDSLETLARDPRYHSIQPITFMDERWGLAELKKRALALRLATEDVEQMLRYVKACETKAELMRFVGEYVESERIG